MNRPEIRTPASPRAMVAYWKRRGFQHFHRKMIGGSAHGRGKKGYTPYYVWAATLRITPICGDKNRCLILRLKK